MKDLKPGGPFALISDVHGNLPALEAVCAEIERRGSFSLVCLGDIVGYGPFPSECLALVRSRSLLTVRGNHDDAAADTGPMPYFTAEAAAAMAWTRRVLKPAEKIWLGNLPLTAQLNGFALAHANFFNPGSWRYTTGTSEARLSLESLAEAVAFFGHTHRPALYRQEEGRLFPEEFRGPVPLVPGRLLANPGSVGQPRDGDPRAAFCLVEPGRGTLELIRVAYDPAPTAEAMTAAGLPRSLADRLVQGR